MILQNPVLPFSADEAKKLERRAAISAGQLARSDINSAKAKARWAKAEPKAKPPKLTADEISRAHGKPCTMGDGSRTWPSLKAFLAENPVKCVRNPKFGFRYI